MINTNKVVHNGRVFAVYIRSQDWESGLHFVSKDEDFIQVGLWGYDSGKKLGPHKHVINERKINITQEVIFVKRGKLRAFIYEDNHDLIKTVDLGPGDLMITLAGGHGYKILEDDTQVLEVKNGPFTGLDDRVPIDEAELVEEEN